MLWPSEIMSQTYQTGSESNASMRATSCWHGPLQPKDSWQGVCGLWILTTWTLSQSESSIPQWNQKPTNIRPPVAVFNPNSLRRRASTVRGKLLKIKLWLIIIKHQRVLYVWVCGQKLSITYLALILNCPRIFYILNLDVSFVEHFNETFGKTGGFNCFFGGYIVIFTQILATCLEKKRWSHFIGFNQ